MSPAKHPGDSLGHWAARLSWAARGALERKLKPLGLTPPMMAALLAVDQGCVKAADVAAHMGVDAAAVTRLMDRLAEADLIGRCALEGDRRSRKISLSEKALALLPKLRQASSGLDKELEAGLSAAERAALIVKLKALTEAAEKL